MVIYAPHGGEVSYIHGRVLDEIGYHCRDYFVAQWDRYKRYPLGVLAHSTHVKGLGTYDSSSRMERSRVNVTLATGIPPARCDRINLGYLDPDSLDVDHELAHAGGSSLVVPRAGEMLYRVGRPPALA